MYKILSIFALLTTITFTSNAQATGPKTGWSEQHNKTHKNLATIHKPNFDPSLNLDLQIEQDVKERENKETGIALNSDVKVEDILAEAQKHIGKRYVWASKGPNTFDCSGFTGYVYKQFGMKIGGCSREQYKGGKAIDKKNARKGDLIFFTSRRSGSNVGHVGIIWEVNKETGDIKFIHASTKRGVIISELEGYYVRSFVGIKRVIE